LNPFGGVAIPSDPVGTAAATPQLVPPGTSVLLSVTVIPGSNPTSTGISVKADLSSIGGSSLQQLFDDATQGDIIAGDNKFSFRTTVGALKGSKDIPITITDTQNRTATVNLPLTIGSLSSENGLIFPHVAIGGGWKTIFLLTNSAPTPATATVGFYSQTATPMPVNINGSLNSSFAITVPANGSTSLIASGSSSTVAGWAKITSSNGVELNGNAAFQFYNGSQLISEASVPAVHPLASIDFYAEEEAGGFSTGIAVANPTSLTAEGELTVRDKQGVIYSTTPIILAPLTQRAEFLFQLIDGAKTGRAELLMNKGYISALVLRMDSSGVLSTVAVSQPGYSAAGTTALFSPQGGVTQRIVSEINNAQASIDIAIYSFTSDAIRDALLDAKNRGLAIRIIADSSQANGSGSEVATLEQAGFQVKRSTGGSGGIMHNKYMITMGGRSSLGVSTGQRTLKTTIMKMLFSFRRRRWFRSTQLTSMGSGLNRDSLKGGESCLRLVNPIGDAISIFSTEVNVKVELVLQKIRNLFSCLQANLEVSTDIEMVFRWTGHFGIPEKARLETCTWWRGTVRFKSMELMVRYCICLSPLKRAMLDTSVRQHILVIISR
jgi:hypothetical protein